MVAIAHELHAWVQGDDGEIYHSGHEPPVYPQPSILDRLWNRLRVFRLVRPLKPIEPPYHVGERVRDLFRKETTVVEIAPKSNHRLGKVKVRRCAGLIAERAVELHEIIPVLSDFPSNQASGDRGNSRNDHSVGRFAPNRVSRLVYANP